jgi:secretion/DNA translocation related CpaE-like protein
VSPHLPPSEPLEAGTPRPLLITADPDLLERVLRVAGTAGADLELAADPGSVRRSWARAPLVLVGSECAAEVVRRGLPRRAGTILVGANADDGEVWQQALGIGAEQVAIFPDCEGWLVERVADAVDGSGGAGHTVCVIGGKGGAGASTLAAALAMAGLRRQWVTTLIDGDPLGGGLDLLVGEEQADGLRWPDLAEVSGRVTSAALRRALPRYGSLSILSWDRGGVLRVPPEVMRVSLAAGRRGSDLVVVDLPRQHPDLSSEPALAAGGPVLLVVQAEVRAVAAAQRVVAALHPHTADLRVVVRGPSPAKISAQVVATSLGLPLVGWLRPEPHRAADQERGEPPGVARGPLSRLCDRFLDSLPFAAVA